MLKKLVHIIFLMLVASIFVTAQDSVVHRVIFIGDAGEMNADQKAVIQSAADKILYNKTTVIYLGDNIYPTGMALPGTKNETQTKEIIQSQYVPMRSKGAPVYFTFDTSYVCVYDLCFSFGFVDATASNPRFWK